VDHDTFARQVMGAFPPGLELQNPGGGTSKLISYGMERVCYRRGNSRFYVEIARLYDNCHCTFLFLALGQMGLVDNIWGTGRSGSPFGVTISQVQVFGVAN
jgi:hypothetical protein